MKKLLFLLFVLFYSQAFAQSYIPDQRYHTGHVGGTWKGQVINYQYLSPILPNTSGAATVDVRAYGAIPNAKKLLNCSISNSNTNLVCTDGAFTPADVGKSYKMYDIVNATYIDNGTLSAYVSGTAMTVSASSSAACTTGNCIMYYGSDSGVFINNALTAAAAYAEQGVNDPNFPHGGGIVRVVFPVGTQGDGYLINETLTPACCNVTIDADAMIYSNTGNGASDRTWAVNAASSTHIKKLLMEVGGGAGVLIGTATVNSSTVIDNLQIWTVGNNFNSGLSPTGQYGLELVGYDFDIKRFWVKGGTIGLYLNTASDVFGEDISVIGSTSGVSIGTGSDINLSNVTCDSDSQDCVAIDASQGVYVKAHAFSTSSATLTNGIQLGQFLTTQNAGIWIDYDAQHTGGTCASVAYTSDSILNINCSNINVPGGVGGSITNSIAYGTNNAASLNINLNQSSGITTTTGTITGSLRATTGNTVKEYANPFVINNPVTTFGMMNQGGL